MSGTKDSVKGKTLKDILVGRKIMNDDEPQVDEAVLSNVAT